MSYVKREWETDEVITKEKLNNVENGLESVSIYKLNKPIDDGETGQQLITNGDGTTSWATIKHKGSVVSYGSCNSATGTVGKTCLVEDLDGLVEGSVIHVKFKNTNTASNPTLNVNGTGAKPILAYNDVPVGNTSETSWLANTIVTLTYDGTGWIINNGGFKAISDSWSVIDCGSWS